MNLLDATVTKILSEPYEKYGKWWVGVEADCWGSPTESQRMFNTKEEALALKVGDTFLC